jgi:hypothetical protein
METRERATRDDVLCVKLAVLHGPPGPRQSMKRIEQDLELLRELRYLACLAQEGDAVCWHLVLERLCAGISEADRRDLE